MEFIFALFVVAIFWYIAYRAWKGVPSCPDEPERTVLVAHNYGTGRYYQEQFGMSFDKNVSIVTEPSELINYGPDDAKFIYVNSDNAEPNRYVVGILDQLESRGAKVDWIGFE